MRDDDMGAVLIELTEAFRKLTDSVNEQAAMMREHLEGVNDMVTSLYEAGIR